MLPFCFSKKLVEKVAEKLHEVYQHFKKNVFLCIRQYSAIDESGRDENTLKDIKQDNMIPFEDVVFADVCRNIAVLIRIQTYLPEYFQT